MGPKPIRFVELESGCHVCVSHRLNADGYFRKRWGTSRGPSKEAEMFHRFVYRAHFGEIPEGHEVDHICGVRGCCAPSHLRTLPRPEHLHITNRTRYRRRHQEARKYWERTQASGTEIALAFGVEQSTGCRWVREWKTP